MTKTDFLDFELDLINDSYAPFRKPNFQATHVSVKSNHTRYVVNPIPKLINKKLTTISKDEYSFKRAKEQYQEALTKGGHKHRLVFNAEKSNGNKRKRKNILYFTHLIVQRLKEKSLNDSLKLVAEILIQRTRTTQFLIVK